MGVSSCNRPEKFLEFGTVNYTNGLPTPQMRLQCFLQILNQFGELQQDVIARQRYAAWRAAEIRKAIKEGRAPTPPPAANNEVQPVMPSLAQGYLGVEHLNCLHIFNHGGK